MQTTEIQFSDVEELHASQSTKNACIASLFERLLW
jgi:hypothetical protein